MWNETNILKIKNEYIIKSLFSFIEYNNILKLIKNNKSLQNKLGINIDNYKNKSDFPKYEYDEKTIKIEENSRKKFPDHYIPSQFTICFTCIFSPIFIIYSILIVVFTFNDSNVKDNYNIKSFDTIKIINPCLFIYDIFIIGFAFILIYYIYQEFSYDFGTTKIIKFILMILRNCVNFLFEGLVIWKLILSYEIKKNGITWFMVLDYLFLCFNLIYMILFLYSTIIFFKSSGYRIRLVSKTVLVSFNGIKIEDYNLPENFKKLEKKQRKKFVVDKYREYDYKISKEEEDLINSINNIRSTNHLPILYICGYSKIPNYFDKEPSEVMVNPEQNIFKLPNTAPVYKFYKSDLFSNLYYCIIEEYLFKYNNGEFINEIY